MQAYIKKLEASLLDFLILDKNILYKKLEASLLDFLILDKNILYKKLK
jgi:hypothetical protein